MPRLTYSKILTRVKAISLVTSQDDLIKDGIQMGLDRATMQELPYLMTKGIIVTVAPYSTGTVAATNGSAAIVGTDTVWTAAMVGRKIRIGGDNAYYLIKTFTNATHITLDTVYQGTTDTDATYSIYKDEYRLPANLDVYKVLRQIENNLAMVDLEASAFDIYEPSPQSQGNPNFDILAGSELDTYTTGTVTGTTNTSILTGTTTEWLSVEGLGKGSRLTIGSNVYTVKSVDSDTQITIYETLVVTITNATYIIHLDNYIIQFFPIPDSAQNIYFRYQRIPDLLFNDQDIPDLPEKYHYLLVTAGLIWAWMTKDKEEATKQETIFEAQKMQFWKRAGNVSRNLTFPRRSQDDIAYSRRRYNPDYSVPIPFLR